MSCNELCGKIEIEQHLIISTYSPSLSISLSPSPLVLVRYSIYRSIAILVNVRYRYLMVSRYFDISNDQTILGRYIVRSGVSSHSILKQPSIWKHCPKTSISPYLLLIDRLSIHQTGILVSSIAKRFPVILKYRRTERIVHLQSNS